jgi:DNA-binding PadR family transcriptional regulator
MAKDVLGEFEHHVMLAALRLKDRAYTTAIVVELEQRTGREVAPAAVYVALRRLEDHGLVGSEYRVGDEEDQRERRYFAVTRTGLAMLRESRRRFSRMWEGLDPQLGESR